MSQAGSSKDKHIVMDLLIKKLHIKAPAETGVFCISWSRGKLVFKGKLLIRGEESADEGVYSEQRG
jgi:hypothetical protein